MLWLLEMRYLLDVLVPISNVVLLPCLAGSTVARLQGPVPERCNNSIPGITLAYSNRYSWNEANLSLE